MALVAASAYFVFKIIQDVFHVDEPYVPPPKLVKGNDFIFTMTFDRQSYSGRKPPRDLFCHENFIIIIIH